MTHTKDDALKLALKALESGAKTVVRIGSGVTTLNRQERDPESGLNQLRKAITAINQALAQPAPVQPAPVQRKPLTDEEIKAVIQSIDPDEKYLPKALRQFARAIEAKLKENT